MRTLSWILCAVVTVSCSSPDTPSNPVEVTDSAGVETTVDTESADTPPGSASYLPELHTWDPARAARGEALLTEAVLGDGLVPQLALQNLWLAWGNVFPVTGEAYWEQFRERYGMHPAPFDNGVYPMGIRDVGGGMASLDCLLCHASVVAGEPVLGVANSTLDLQGFYDDLVKLGEIAPTYGYPSFPVPFTLVNRTGAAGATDAFGLGMELSLAYGPPGVDIETHYGFQRPVAWWTMRYKNRIYSDGSGSIEGHRTMAATLLSFGLSWSELQAMDEDFEDIRHYLLSLSPPEWPQSVDASAAERGAAVYSVSCAGCHGDAVQGFPDRRVPDVGTDPLRAERFTEDEAAWVNASWFGQPPMESTRAYVAPPLVGIWARAPYLHNGSIPTLRALLDAASRPQRWQRTGSSAEDFDWDAVGWRYTQPESGGDPATLEGRAIYDTAREGLSAAGHPYGEGLSDAERDDLLEYLKTL